MPIQPDAQGTPDLWVVTADILATLLPLWDAWCPDDGRPAAALATARCYLQDSTSLARPALASALAAVQAAQAMACAVPLTLENWLTISLAWTTAAAIALFLSALLTPASGGAPLAGGGSGPRADATGATPAVGG